MKISQFIILFSFITILVSCNKGPIIGGTQQDNFIKLFGNSGIDVGKDVVQTNSGEYVFVGTITSTSKKKEILLTKTDASGNAIWSKQFGDINDDFGNSVILLGNNEYGIIGTKTTSTLSTNIVFIRMNSNGDVLLNKTFDFPENQEGNCLINISGSYILLAGSTTEEYLFNNAGSKDVMCIKYDYQNDTVIWKKQYGYDGDEYCTDVTQLADGSFVAIGSSNSFSYPNNKMYVLKIFSYGLNESYKTFGDRFKQTIGTSLFSYNNGFLFVGTATNPDDDEQTYFVRTSNEIEDIIVDTSYGEKGLNEGQDIIMINNKIFLLATTTEISNTDIQIQQMDMFGMQSDTSIHPLLFGGTTNESASSFAKTTDDGFIIIGTTEFETNSMINLIKVSKDAFE